MPPFSVKMPPADFSYLGEKRASELAPLSWQPLPAGFALFILKKRWLQILLSLSWRATPADLSALILEDLAFFFYVSGCYLPAIQGAAQHVCRQFCRRTNKARPCLGRGRPGHRLDGCSSAAAQEIRSRDHQAAATGLGRWQQGSEARSRGQGEEKWAVEAFGSVRVHQEHKQAQC